MQVRSKRRERLVSLTLSALAVTALTALGPASGLGSSAEAANSSFVSVTANVTSGTPSTLALGLASKYDLTNANRTYAQPFSVRNSTPSRNDDPAEVTTKVTAVNDFVFTNYWVWPVASSAECTANVGIGADAVQGVANVSPAIVTAYLKRSEVQSYCVRYEFNTNVHTRNGQRDSGYSVQSTIKIGNFQALSPLMTNALRTNAVFLAENPSRAWRTIGRMASTSWFHPEGGLSAEYGAGLALASNTPTKDFAFSVQEVDAAKRSFVIHAAVPLNSALTRSPGGVITFEQFDLNNPNQRWTIQKAENGYSLIAEDSGYCLSGLTLRMELCNGTWNQTFPMGGYSGPIDVPLPGSTRTVEETQSEAEPECLETDDPLAECKTTEGM